MKPWPAAVLLRFPLPPTGSSDDHDLESGPVPERPWWTWHGVGAFPDWITRAGLPRASVDWSPPNPPSSLIGHALAVLQRDERGTPAFDEITYAPGFAHPRREAATSLGLEEVHPGARGADGDLAGYDATMTLDTWGDVLGLLARIDAERPLPHPGYRVGQVWARADGDARVVQHLAPDLAPMVVELTAALFAFCDHLPDGYDFLVADPACPHLAPWSRP